jgi:hypothetical protein
LSIVCASALLFGQDHRFITSAGGGGSIRTSGEKMGVFLAAGSTAITMFPSH